MFGSIALEVLIGLVLVYLLLSLVCSTIQEGLASRLNWRGWMLCDAIARLFNEPLPEKSTAKRGPWTQAIYAHPLLDALHRDEDRPPSYIPNDVFADALVDLLATPAPGVAAPIAPSDQWVGVLRALDRGAAAAGPLDPKTADALRLLAGRARQKIDAAAPDAAQQALTAFKTEIDGWYQNTMERTSGWYKRKSQRAQFWIAGLVVIATNADTVMISEQLATDPKAREAAANAAAKFVEQHAELNPGDDSASGAGSGTAGTPSNGTNTQGVGAAADLRVDPARVKQSFQVLKEQTEAAQIKIGWPDPARVRLHEEIATVDQRRDELLAQRKAAETTIKTQNASEEAKLAAQADLAGAEAALPLQDERESKAKSELRWWWSRKFLGLLITMCAVALGAPFWFQMLEKLVKLRGSGERPDSAGADGSTAAQAGGKPGTSVALVGGSAGSKPGTPAVAAAVLVPGGDSHASAAEVSAALEKLDDRYWANVAERWSATLALAAGSAPADDATVAVFLARMASLAYEPKWTIDARLKAFRAGQLFGTPTFFSQKGTQAFAVRIGDDAIVAYRGTEPSQLEDIVTDAESALTARPAYTGKVHMGFADALELIDAEMRDWLDKNAADAKRIFVTGHSLGAALATLHFCRYAKGGAADKYQLVTFGSPRVGDSPFCQAFEARTSSKAGPLRKTRVLRFVNNRDIVTRVAPRTMKYEHVGAECYIDSDGKLHFGTDGSSKWQDFVLLVIDGLAAFKAALKKPIGDHSMDLYVRRLENWTNWSA